MEIDLTPRPSYLRRTTCVKCSQNGHVVLNGKDVYCRTCFDDYCAHKFRSSFGKHKIFQSPNQRVLIAVSGGPTSAGILIDLIRRSCSSESHRKLQIQPEILYIAESENIASCAGFGRDTSFPFHVVHIASIFDDDSTFEIATAPLITENFNIDNLPGSNNFQALIKLFESFSSDTSRLDFYRRIKTYLHVRCARKLGIEFLITGESCTALSSRILSNTTQGRGGQTRDDVHVLDLRWANNSLNAVRIVRPLREFQNREIAYYDHFHRLYEKIDFDYDKPDFIPSIFSTSSLQSASDDFVFDLQSRFPATVSTLFASASKLLSTSSVKRGVNGEKSGDGAGRCRLCASELMPDEDTDYDMMEGFCYGCSLTLSELRDINRLPSWFLKR